MTKPSLIALAAFGSFALLAGAFMFQFMGFPPCQMCLWQRYPHAVAVVVGLLAILLGRFQSQLAILGAIAAAITGGIGVYHTGVERGWWEGPTSCTSGGALSGDLLSTDIAPIVMCDDVVWSLLGLSMASYNALISFGLAAIWIAAARR
ncbi:disulfide bond formation protein B [Octadecabacter sp. 1_MG-2023]|uniref:disulfide bond formation protein B n=1 Tax=unclassified Octadecabacter TaxID=196158 RepID=UPI001C098648|nr:MULTISPECIES: disulfide bond formation protein B [unclassified Octadecabacter]MBU2993240.1 disulfide bond formation protein B [Octadecabacter sp. B2R22]MDO6733305.1 disulfide bond formation protein B [Octadecabacter sp. 1_MG-2023]